VGTGLIDEEEVGGIERPDLLAPGGARRLIPFRGD
jgi:hypothetical protein